MTFYKIVNIILSDVSPGIEREDDNIYERIERKKKTKVIVKTVEQHSNVCLKVLDRLYYVITPFLYVYNHRSM